MISFCVILSCQLGQGHFEGHCYFKEKCFTERCKCSQYILITIFCMQISELYTSLPSIWKVSCITHCILSIICSLLRTVVTVIRCYIPITEKVLFLFSQTWIEIIYLQMFSEFGIVEANYYGVQGNWKHRFRTSITTLISLLSSFCVEVKSLVISEKPPNRRRKFLWISLFVIIIIPNDLRTYSVLVLRRNTESAKTLII